MHAMLIEIVDPHRLKGTCAYMQCDHRARDSGRRELPEQRRIEVQARGRRSDGAVDVRQDRLIALAIDRRWLVFNVWRQRHFASAG